MDMRTALVFIAIISLIGLGVLDLASRNWRVGIAALLIAGANALLLLP